MQTPLPQALHEGFADVALISEYLAPQCADHGLQWLAIIHIAACDLECPDLALMVNEQVELEAKEPTHATAAPLGQVSEHLVATDACVIANR